MMLAPRKKCNAKVWMLSVEQIVPSPFQARTQFEEQELSGLAVSILEHGLLQPITVRKVHGGYELVAGERRLRACRMAGLKQVPAILRDYPDDQTAALGLVENLQRQDLNPFEQARGIREMIQRWGCTQEQAAKRLGMAQPTLNNKLRLLQLPEELQQFCLEHHLGERHARAVIRLENPEQQAKALQQFVAGGMNARQADALVDGMLQQKPEKPKRRMMVKDVRIFANTIQKAIQVMVEAGIPASARKQEGEDYLEYIVHIPLQKTGGA